MGYKSPFYGLQKPFLWAMIIVLSQYREIMMPLRQQEKQVLQVEQE
jgi:hypothetical protein